MNQSYVQLSRPKNLWIFLLFLCSCVTVSLVSEYDEITDQALNNTHEQVSSFLVKMERTYRLEEGKYAHHVEFYDGLKSDMAVIKTRITAFGGDKYVSGHVQSLDSMVIILEKMHKEGFINVEEIVLVENAFNSAFGAIIKYQAALKSREKYKSN